MHKPPASARPAPASGQLAPLKAPERIEPQGVSEESFDEGACWLGLTIAFEFLGGHYLFGSPWDTLLADYNLSQGRIWILVLVATAVGPVVAARTRHLFLHQL